MAVSHFLRPLCLYKRISYFKQGLKKAVVKFQPIETEDNIHWNSSSFWFKPVGYKTEKRPCQNCMVMFQNLSGFLGSRDNLREEGVGETILAACAEYVPTNQCLPDVAESDIEAVNVVLTNFRDKCSLYFEKFPENVSKCDSAYESYKSEKDESRKVEILRNVYDTYVKDKIHIFGVKPEYNNSLSHSV